MNQILVEDQTGAKLGAANSVGGADGIPRSYALNQSSATESPVMQSTIRCLSCGATFLVAVGPCAQCGGAIELSIPLTGVEAKLVAGNVGTVLDSSTPLGGQEIRYTAPTGSQSNASLVGDRLNVQVKPPIDVGRPGEPRVMACILAHLAKAGKEPTVLPAKDQTGEDGVLQIAGARVTVQIVTATPNAAFWGDVARGNGAVQTELTDAVEWIHSAISKKANLYPRENKSLTLLAVDLVHMGVLSDPVLCERYLVNHGDPSARFDFGAVWLVGPTENHVFSLGSSRW